MQGLSYSAIASLMVIGGFDNRPRIGGNALIKGKNEGLLSLKTLIYYLYTNLHILFSKCCLFFIPY